MSEFEPEQVADDERTTEAAQKPDAGAEHPAASGDAGDRDPESNPLTQSAAETQSAAGAESPADETEGGAESPVAAALAELDGLPGRPVADHPDIYGRAHAQLQGALSAIDDA